MTAPRAIEINIKGLKEIEASLVAAPRKVRERIESKILRQIGQIFLDEAIRQAPVGASKNIFGQFRTPGKLKKSIKAFIQSVDRWKGIELVVKPTVRYAHLVEYGHRVVIWGQKKGMARANPFMRRTFDGKADEVLDAGVRLMEETVAEALTKGGALKTRLG